jgi:hypothetical protein
LLLNYVDETGRYLGILGKVAEQERELKWTGDQDQQ